MKKQYKVIIEVNGDMWEPYKPDVEKVKENIETVLEEEISMTVISVEDVKEENQ